MAAAPTNDALLLAQNLAVLLTRLNPSSSQAEQNSAEYQMSCKLKVKPEVGEQMLALLEFLQEKIRNANTIAQLVKPMSFFPNLPKGARLAIYTVKDMVISKATTVENSLHNIRECDLVVIGNADEEALEYNPDEITKPLPVTLEIQDPTAIRPKRVVFATGGKFYLYDGYSIHHCINRDIISDLKM